MAWIHEISGLLGWGRLPGIEQEKGFPFCGHISNGIVVKRFMSLEVFPPPEGEKYVSR